MKNLTMYFHSTALKAIALALVCLAASISHAGALPDHYPEEFLWSGTIEKVTSTSIIIADREFSLNPNMSVHLLKSYNTNIQDLKIGMTVGCQLSDANKLNAVWEFPDSLSSASGPWAGNLLKLQQ